MKLPPRLAAVASFVPPCKMLADIGTDHAYIPIYLVKRGIALHAVASDIVKGPADIAAANIKKHGLHDKISVVVGSGLDKIPQSDVIVIAGMGGKIICEILQEGLPVARKAKCIVLQPMTAISEVRRFLYAKSFTIYDEAIAKEGDKLYNIIAVKKGKTKVEDDLYYYIGEKLIENEDKLLGQLIQKKISALDVAIHSLSKSNDGAKKMTELIHLRQRFSEVYHDNCS
ncbi:MAG: class I SAM-dependent methyltransferase [Firmicutes bacterium]|nr:class I SAM-dependent methyltransferase [Bacillota bacterium]